MFAYFIGGGPLDLTKRAIKEPTASTWYAPVPRKELTFQKPEMGPEQRIDVLRHEYRRYFTQGDNVIFVYEGIR